MPSIPGNHAADNQRTEGQNVPQQSEKNVSIIRELFRKQKEMQIVCLNLKVRLSLTEYNSTFTPFLNDLMIIHH